MGRRRKEEEARRVWVDESAHVPTFVPRPGAIRARGVSGVDWIYANPGDRIFSTVSMIAIEYWDGETWASIEGET